MEELVQALFKSLPPKTIVETPFITHGNFYLILNKISKKKKKKEKNKTVSKKLNMCISKRYLRQHSIKYR